eukprot:Phypoly_transcript_11296.p1 GENE.Phypoly_transcript_11296~~Phypoly_transcript_11296.p1  ORF type:complete len:320 (+),score=57.93 Phypoly_transcript_11296:104-1063(+)
MSAEKGKAKTTVQPNKYTTKTNKRCVSINTSSETSANQKQEPPKKATENELDNPCGELLDAILQQENITQNKHEEDENLDPTNVFVKYLPSNVDDENLRKLFAPFGTIVSAKVMKDNANGASLGYGFVKFSSKKEANLAITKMGGQRLKNKTLLCKLANPFACAIPSRNLYIKPLPPTCTEGKLYMMFRQFGEIQAIKIVRKPTKQSDVIGLVRFTELLSAVQALEKTNRAKLIPGWPVILVQYAETEEERTRRKASYTPPQKFDQFTTSQFEPDMEADYNFPTIQYSDYCCVYFPVYYPVSQEQAFVWYTQYSNSGYP